MVGDYAFGRRYKKLFQFQHVLLGKICFNCKKINKEEESFVLQIVLTC